MEPCQMTTTLEHKSHTDISHINAYESLYAEVCQKLFTIIQNIFNNIINKQLHFSIQMYVSSPFCKSLALFSRNPTSASFEHRSLKIDGDDSNM